MVMCLLDLSAAFYTLQYSVLFDRLIVQSLKIAIIYYILYYKVS